MLVDLTGTPERLRRATKVRDRAALERLEGQVIEMLEGGLGTKAACEAIEDLRLVPLVFCKLRSVADATWWITHSRRFDQTDEAPWLS